MASSKRTCETKSVCVVLICGLPGSGKSTLRERMRKNGWSHVNQDEMLTADACEKALVKALKAGNSVVVDRCNVTPSDRRLWLQHAKRAVDKGIVKGKELHFEAVWMATPPEICKERARERTGHETLNPEKVDDVVDSFCRGLQPPKKSGQEPYDAVHVVVSDADADSVVQRFMDPACVNKAITLAPPAVALAAAAAHAAEIGAAAHAAVENEEIGPAQVAAMGAEVFLLRHAERADRARGHDDGWPDDPPLTKDGRKNAKQAGCAMRSLASAPWAPVVYSSPFYRCLQTANEVAGELGLAVRVEPGLSEFYGARLFDREPRLREPQDALEAALQRSQIDLAHHPDARAPPQWPEPGHAANARVLRAARAIAARHPGQAVCLVCHGHGLVAATRHLPDLGGGAVDSQCGYCALSHIATNGVLIRNLDQSYLKAAVREEDEASPADIVLDTPVGSWAAGWQWEERGPGRVGEVVDALLALSLDDALAACPELAQLFHRGSPCKQRAWRAGWSSRSEEVRAKLQQACAHGIFRSFVAVAPAAAM